MPLRASPAAVEMQTSSASASSPVYKASEFASILEKAGLGEYMASTSTSPSTEAANSSDASSSTIAVDENTCLKQQNLVLGGTAPKQKKFRHRRCSSSSVSNSKTKPEAEALECVNSDSFKMDVDMVDENVAKASKVVERGCTGLPSHLMTKDLPKKKGLREFSLLVCERLRERQVTNYNEVSDDLVAELAPAGAKGEAGQPKTSEAKNIRRRVYDALNVLLAIGVIDKHKKEIVWRGLPNEPLESETLRKRRDEKRQVLRQKKNELSQLMCQYVARRNLAARNARSLSSTASPCSSSSPSPSPLASPIISTVPVAPVQSPRLALPFLIVNVPLESHFKCDMNEGRNEVSLSCSHPMTLNEHNSILAMLGCQNISPWELPRIVPRELTPFYPEQSKSKLAVFGDPKLQLLPWRRPE